MTKNRFGMSILLASVFLCRILTAQSSSPLHGEVKDTDGAAIPGAYILVHADEAGRHSGSYFSERIPPDTIVKSDGRGRFSIADLEPGFYDVCIMAAAFEPNCRKLLVKKGQAIQHNVRLRVSQDVMRALGDKFSNQ